MDSRTIKYVIAGLIAASGATLAFIVLFGPPMSGPGTAGGGALGGAVGAVVGGTIARMRAKERKDTLR